MIYFDNHRATRPATKVQNRLATASWWDLQAPYASAVDVTNLYELVGARKEEHKLIITEEAAERVVADVYRNVVYETGKNFFLAPVTENAPIRKALEQVGCVTRYLPVNAHGELTVDVLERYWNPKVSLLALSWANPLTGAIHPIEEIADFCKAKGITLYVQGSEVVGKLFLRLSELPIDYFSFSGSMIHGPQGIGCLFQKGSGVEAKNGILMDALNTIAGDVIDFMDGMNTEIAYLRSVLESNLPEATFFGGKRLPNVSCFAFPHIHGELLAFRLKEKGLLVSYGGGHVQRLEYILREMGVNERLAKSAISIALSMDTTEEEIKKAIHILRESL